jgi:nucleoid-associated protein YgaU
MTPVEVPVARAGELFGSVRRYEYSDGARQEGELRPIDIEQYAVIEATDDVGSYRTTTDELGRFSFRNLRPGQWAVRVVFLDLPDGFRVEESPGKHSVAPGERVEIELRTKPRKRSIKFVSGGRVTAGTPGLVPPNAAKGPEVAQKDSTKNGSDRAGRIAVTSGEPARSDSTSNSLASNADSTTARAAAKKEMDSQVSPRGDSLQVNGRNPSSDEFVANRIRRAFEEALRVASDLDPDYVWQDRYVVVDSTFDDRCAPSPIEGRHEVVSGESLAFLARKYYCDPVMWPKIWFANYAAAPNPNLIRVGQELVVPTREGSVYGFNYQPETDRGAKPMDWESRPISITNIYTVRADDTLYGIAKRTMGNGFLWPRIWMVNRGLVGEDTELIDGMELIIPGNERMREEVRVLFGVR